MMPNAPLPYSTSTAHLYDLLASKVLPGKPSFFTLNAQIPSQGRTDTPVAATPQLQVVVKVYASGGENELHAHVAEDHIFIVMHGQATFYGPQGEARTVGQYEGVSLPHGTLYRFSSSSDEPLVLIRVGCPAFADRPRQGRIGADGQPMGGFSAENKEVPVVLSGKQFPL